MHKEAVMIISQEFVLKTIVLVVLLLLLIF